jgi:hypothetical protein
MGVGAARCARRAVTFAAEMSSLRILQRLNDNCIKIH